MVVDTGRSSGSSKFESANVSGSAFAREPAGQSGEEITLLYQLLE